MSKKPQFKSTAHKAAYNKKQTEAKKMVIYRNQGLKPEVKNIDVVQSILLAGAGTSGSWSVPILLNGSINGTQTFQRVGRKFLMKSLLLRLATAVSAGNVGAQIRCLVVYDSQPSPATATTAIEI